MTALPHGKAQMVRQEKLLQRALASLRCWPTACLFVLTPTIILTLLLALGLPQL